MMIPGSGFAGRALIALLALMFALSLSPGAHAQNTIRLGWQTPWATQGQLVQAMKHSNITELTGISVDYIGFAYGGPLNRAALSGEVDVLLTADQPAEILLSKRQGYKIVARMMYNRVCLYVPPASEIAALDDFKSKSLAGPIGAAAERVSMAALADAGVASGDIKLSQLEMEQQGALIRTAKPDDRTWGPIDGMFGFDPLPTIWKSAGIVKLISCGKVVSVVLASNEMQTTRRQELVAFLKAFGLAWNQFRRDPDKYGQLFLDEAKMTTALSALDEAASIEPNRWAASFSEINMTFNDNDMKVLQDTQNFLMSRKLVPETYQFSEDIDLSFLKEAFADGSLRDLAERVR
jgi:ABC-type nitrate/sulfonate/bicarbonate transport system substrate-binding protein